MSLQHDEACRIVNNINQRAAALSRSLLIALAALEQLATEDDYFERRRLHQQTRRDIHAIIGEALDGDEER